MKIEGIWVSPKSNYWSYGKNAPGDAPTYSLDVVQCDAGHGLVGDRFYDYKEDYAGQVTFISKEILDKMREEMGTTFSYDVFRRNVLVSGVDPLTLVGKEFSIGDAKFLGAADCTPCKFWDAAVAEGTFAWLAKNSAGGLRAKIITSGEMHVGDQIEVV